MKPEESLWFKTPAAAQLALMRDEVLAEWMRRVRSEVPGAKEMSNAALVDTLPLFLEYLCESLEAEHPRNTANESSNITLEHGSERARRSSYGPDQLVHEYQILRDVILELLGQKVELSRKQINLIVKCVDTSVQESMATFFLVHTQLKEQFVASLTHDLRNPLSAAKLSNEMMIVAIEKLPNPEARESLRRLAQRSLSSIKRVDRMIQDLLDTSMLHAGEELPLKIHELDVLSLVRGIVGDLSLRDQRQIRVEGESALARWDADAVRRALENIMQNALKYGEEGKPVSVKLEPSFERMQVSVHNFGNPIPLESQKYLFDAYHRTSAAKASGKKGWGIGLSVARGVTRAHGGSLIVDSAPERGTTFTLDLPLEVKTASA